MDYGLDDDIVKSIMKVCGGTGGIYHDLRKTLVQCLGLVDITKSILSQRLTFAVLRNGEMDVSLVDGVADGEGEVTSRSVLFGYLIPVGPDFCTCTVVS